MTKQQRRGLKMLLDTSPYNAHPTAGLTHATYQAFYAGKHWIERQLELDDRRKKPRGKYRRLR